MEKESLELLLGQGLSVEKIGKRFGKDPSTVSYWMAKYGLEAVNREKHAAKGGLDQDRLVISACGTGKTIAEMAADVGLSKTTVRHWFGRYGLKTSTARGRRPAGETRVASDEAPRQVDRLDVLREHGETEWCSRAVATIAAGAVGSRRCAATPEGQGDADGGSRRVAA